jgi:hypothetical protein
MLREGWSLNASADGLKNCRFYYHLPESGFPRYRYAGLLICQNMASVEAFKPLSITGVIIIPVSGKHCIVRAPPSCSDFLVAFLLWSAQRVDKQALATLRSVFWVILIFWSHVLTVDHLLHLDTQH